MKFKTLLILCLSCIQLAAFAQLPKREFRGAWLHTVSGDYQGMPTNKLKERLVKELDNLQEAGINAVIFQVRPAADAFYPSTIEPWSRYLTGTQGVAPAPLWDPLSFVIKECHQRNMELHAWINPYRVKTNIKHQLSKEHIYFKHPEWFLQYGNQLFFDPGLPESRRFICKVVKDIVDRYDVDAIHMDDYFYPYPIQGKDFPDAVSFARYGKGFATKGDWRRNNVDLLIEEIHHLIRGIKPWVKFGISPFGIYRNQSSDPAGSKTNGLQNYDQLYADVLLWVNKGWIDYNVPQIYWEIGHPVADYETLIQWWAKHASNRPLFIGESVVRTTEKKDLENPSINQLQRKMELQHSLKSVNGACQWPGKAVINNVGHYRDDLIKTYYKYPALQPLFTFMDDKAPKKVRSLKSEWIEKGYYLTWKAPRAKKEMDQAKHYVVYRFNKEEKVDISQAAKIVTITQDTALKLPYVDGKTSYRYVVTALDRLQNESKIKSEKVDL